MESTEPQDTPKFISVENMNADINTMGQQLLTSHSDPTGGHDGSETSSFTSEVNRLLESEPFLPDAETGQTFVERAMEPQDFPMSISMSENVASGLPQLTSHLNPPDDLDRSETLSTYSEVNRVMELETNLLGNDSENHASNANIVPMYMTVAGNYCGETEQVEAVSVDLIKREPALLSCEDDPFMGATVTNVTGNTSQMQSLQDSSLDQTSISDSLPCIPSLKEGQTCESPLTVQVKKEMDSSLTEALDLIPEITIKREARDMKTEVLKFLKDPQKTETEDGNYSTILSVKNIYEDQQGNVCVVGLPLGAGHMETPADRMERLKKLCKPCSVMLTDFANTWKEMDIYSRSFHQRKCRKIQPVYNIDLMTSVRGQAQAAVKSTEVKKLGGKRKQLSIHEKIQQRLKALKKRAMFFKRPQPTSQALKNRKSPIKRANLKRKEEKEKKAKKKPAATLKKTVKKTSHSAKINNSRKTANKANSKKGSSLKVKPGIKLPLSKQAVKTKPKVVSKRTATKPVRVSKEKKKRNQQKRVANSASKPAARLPSQSPTRDTAVKAPLRRILPDVVPKQTALKRKLSPSPKSASQGDRAHRVYQYKCLHCPYKTGGHARIVAHIYQHSDVAPYSCGSCKEMIYSREDCLQHSRVVHPRQKVSYKKNMINESKYFTVVDLSSGKDAEDSLPVKRLLTASGTLKKASKQAMPRRVTRSTAQNVPSISSSVSDENSSSSSNQHVSSAFETGQSGNTTGNVASTLLSIVDLLTSDQNQRERVSEKIEQLKNLIQSSQNSHPSASSYTPSGGVSGNSAKKTNQRQTRRQGRASVSNKSQRLPAPVTSRASPCTMPVQTNNAAEKESENQPMMDIGQARPPEHRGIDQFNLTPPPYNTAVPQGPVGSTCDAASQAGVNTSREERQDLNNQISQFNIIAPSNQFSSQGQHVQNMNQFNLQPSATTSAISSAQYDAQHLAPPSQQMAPFTQHFVPSSRQMAPSNQQVAPSSQQMASSRQQVAPPSQKGALSSQQMAPFAQHLVPSNQQVTPSSLQVAPPRHQVAPSSQQMAPSSQQVAPSSQQMASSSQQVAPAGQPYPVMINPVPQAMGRPLYPYVHQQPGSVHGNSLVRLPERGASYLDSARPVHAYPQMVTQQASLTAGQNKPVASSSLSQVQDGQGEVLHPLLPPQTVANQTIPCNSSIPRMDVVNRSTSVSQNEAQGWKESRGETEVVSEQVLLDRNTPQTLSNLKDSLLRELVKLRQSGKMLSDQQYMNLAKSLVNSSLEKNEDTRKDQCSSPQSRMPIGHPELNPVDRDSDENVDPIGDSEEEDISFISETFRSNLGSAREKLSSALAAQTDQIKADQKAAKKKAKQVDKAPKSEVSADKEGRSQLSKGTASEKKHPLLFKCSLCGFEANLATEAQDHVYEQHMSVKVYRCIHPDCGLKLSTLSSLKRHFEKSHKNVPFQYLKENAPSVMKFIKVITFDKKVNKKLSTRDHVKRPRTSKTTARKSTGKQSSRNSSQGETISSITTRQASHPVVNSHRASSNTANITSVSSAVPGCVSQNIVEHFKCSFCEFQCPDQHGILEHLRGAHLQKAQSVGSGNTKTQKSRGEEMCRVCGDYALTFGSKICNSCKIFYLKAIDSKKQFKHCTPTCIITLETRDMCPGCRFLKCVTYGVGIEVEHDRRLAEMRKPENVWANMAKTSSAQQRKDQSAPVRTALGTASSYSGDVVLDKDYVCGLCGFCTKFPFAMEDHMKVHKEASGNSKEDMGTTDVRNATTGSAKSHRVKVRNGGGKMKYVPENIQAKTSVAGSNKTKSQPVGNVEGTASTSKTITDGDDDNEIFVIDETDNQSSKENSDTSKKMVVSLPFSKHKERTKGPQKVEKNPSQERTASVNASAHVAGINTAPKNTLQESTVTVTPKPKQTVAAPRQACYIDRHGKKVCRKCGKCLKKMAAKPPPQAPGEFITIESDDEEDEDSGKKAAKDNTTNTRNSAGNKNEQGTENNPVSPDVKEDKKDEEKDSQPIQKKTTIIEYDTGSTLNMEVFDEDEVCSDDESQEEKKADFVKAEAVDSFAGETNGDLLHGTQIAVEKEKNSVSAVTSNTAQPPDVVPTSTLMTTSTKSSFTKWLTSPQKGDRTLGEITQDSTNPGSLSAMPVAKKTPCDSGTDNTQLPKTNADATTTTTQSDYQVYDTEDANEKVSKWLSQQQAPIKKEAAPQHYSTNNNVNKDEDECVIVLDSDEEAV
ncbi:uncharacterized protein LOC106177508 [Lingula anatina]|uniref:Uncharacterized protein LOC106177508 n=1 Tax=Lingula anatina TaxID=7574 RepID=A0A1S3K0F0_LINAN|nr:uncharacterized protein LOC106177508 [Lingula anatina]XP_013415751.1 uncharacterized protein LOC106177508 [Lingula anatina]XP_013415752.1 uncharacterized protein LOC106177508 [Lingula anatina]|eukprot:XP_013415750.1 uncharacterized protein LOC106177508 [Lingula anatina]